LKLCDIKLQVLRYLVSREYGTIPDFISLTKCKLALSGVRRHFLDLERWGLIETIGYGPNSRNDKRTRHFRITDAGKNVLLRVRGEES